MDLKMYLLKFLKKKRIIAVPPEKAVPETASESIVLKKPVDLFIRDAITGMGTILQEDLENHFYITSVKVGFMKKALSYALIQREEETAHIVVYAHEGLIPQRLCFETLSKLKEKLQANEASPPIP